MKKSKKSLLVVSLALFLLIGFVTPAFAASKSCPCGGTLTLSSKTVIHQSYRYHDCTEHSNCTVKTTTNTVQYTYNCSDCHYGDTDIKYVDLTPYHIR